MLEAWCCSHWISRGFVLILEVMRVHVLSAVVSGRRWMDKAMRDSSSDLCFLLCADTALQ